MNKFGLNLESSTDEDFFGTLRTHNTLGQLFGVDNSANSSGNDNQTLKYQPVKQSDHNNDTATASESTTVAAWQTQLVKVVHAFKAGESVGKVGVALLYNGADAYQMIIYKSKSKVLSTVTLLSPSQPVTGRELHMQSRYLQYYDNGNIYWSLLFDKQTDEREFVDKLLEIGVSVQQQQEQQSPQQQQEVERLSSPVPPKPAKTTTAHATLNSKTKHSKASLINRMAKMGQPLPKYTAVVTATAGTTTEFSDDSSDTEVIATPGALGAQHLHKPVVVPRNQRSIHATHSAHILPVASATTLASTNVGLYNGAATASMETQFMQMLLTENRTQNTEMRMNMNKLEGKLEKVLDKIDCLHGSSGHQRNKEDEILELEEKLLELKKENRKLKQSLESQKSSRSTDDENDIESILQEHKSDLDIMGLSTTATDLTGLVGGLFERIQSLESTAQEMMERIATGELRIMQVNDAWKAEIIRHDETSQKREELQNQLDRLQETLKCQQEQNTQLEVTLQQEQQRFSEQLAAERTEATNTVKTIMNDLYANVAMKLGTLSEPKTTDVILGLLGRTIREETLKVIGSGSSGSGSGAQ